MHHTPHFGVSGTLLADDLTAPPVRLNLWAFPLWHVTRTARHDRLDRQSHTRSGPPGTRPPAATEDRPIRYRVAPLLARSPHSSMKRFTDARTKELP
ncbi:hypothetical protein STRTUCAR8_00513 [Streptomyces turgidiscabies Car8]|uniref:Uncharacterized protein n=1 Tax=Streptomyces turgidiscabies (strain Car8) TaxID=698760 RepID=L7EUH8_STRT8|nr:hypothetical protein STRTUCAR8_00513 [Streptomyces turgidiscabies Car8]